MLVYSIRNTLATLSMIIDAPESNLTNGLTCINQGIRAILPVFVVCCQTKTNIPFRNKSLKIIMMSMLLLVLQNGNKEEIIIISCIILYIIRVYLF